MYKKILVPWDGRESVRSEQLSLAKRASDESGASVQAELLDGDVLPALVAYAERTGPDTPHVPRS